MKASSSLATPHGVESGQAATPKNAATQTQALPPYTRKLLTWSFAIALLPPIVLVLALASKSLFLLDYDHVISGGSWTGFDLYSVLVVGRMMSSLDIPARVEVAKRLTPLTFFVLSSLAATAVTSGIYLSQRLGLFSLHDPWILAAGTVVLVLMAQGFGIFMPSSLRIFLEFAKKRPDFEKIAKLNMRIIRLEGIQGALQVAIILIMAHLTI